MNYYNDNDPKICAWLRELIKDGLLLHGEVDQRSIADIKASELAGFTQCHFFAGIGGWPEALRLAKWPQERAVWTGSCPCQPLSCAGLGKGHADKRHLWPAFYELISKCKPATVFGEQVASKDGREWLAGIRADLEDLGYAFGSADLCAASVSAPHIRQRLYWVANANGGKPIDRGLQRSRGQLQQSADKVGNDGMEQSFQSRLEGLSRNVSNRDESGRHSTQSNRPITKANEHNFWSDAIWIPTSDPITGKTIMRRAPAEPEVFPLADGLSYSMGSRRSSRSTILKGAGNSIVPQVAQVFIEAFLEI